jgi:hypothetical protein
VPDGDATDDRNSHYVRPPPTATHFVPEPHAHSALLAPFDKSEQKIDIEIALGTRRCIDLMPAGKTETGEDC